MASAATRSAKFLYPKPFEVSTSLKTWYNLSNKAWSAPLRYHNLSWAGFGVSTSALSKIDRRLGNTGNTHISSSDLGLSCCCCCCSLLSRRRRISTTVSNLGFPIRTIGFVKRQDSNPHPMASCLRELTILSNNGFSSRLSLQQTDLFVSVHLHEAHLMVKAYGYPR